MRAKFIFEKFTLDSDPIEDMGIGLPIAHIKVGDIIKIKKIGLASLFNRINDRNAFSIVMDKSKYSHDLPTHYCGFIMKKYIKGNKMTLHIPFFSAYNGMIEQKNIFMETKRNTNNLTYGIATFSISIWDEYLEVIK